MSANDRETPASAGARLRAVGAGDTEALWRMLYHAAHVAEEPPARAAAYRANPDLARYVEGWGCDGDLGVLAEDEGGRVLGAVWLRLLRAEDRWRPEYVDDRTPELAIAVLPGARGQGLGGQLLEALIARARQSVPAIVLTVREGNRARALYERFGFRVVGPITNRVGARSWKMVLRFGPGGSDAV